VVEVTHFYGTARAPRFWLALLTRAPCSSPLVTGPSSLALVTQNRCSLVRPAASAAGLASPAGPEAASRLLQHSVPKRLRACCSSRSRSGFALARTPQSPRGYAASLARRSPPSDSLVAPLVFVRANPTGIRLLSSSSTLVVNSFDCPASQVKKT
jgi:hypothetical protein